MHLRHRGTHIPMVRHHSRCTSGIHYWPTSILVNDTALVESFSHSEEDEAFSLLNCDLQKLDEWSHTWNMSFNAQKIVYIIIINKRNQQQKPVLMMNNVILENAEHHKHLAINIYISWDEHINTVINKSNKKIGLIWCLSLKVPHSCLTNIYTYYIRPFLEYGCVLYPAVMAQWLGCRTRNHKVASSSPVTAMSSFGDWFTQP